MTYEFKNGKIKQYLGGIEYFLEQRKMQNMREVELQQDAKRHQKEAIAPKAEAGPSRDAIKQAEKALKQAEREEAQAQIAFEQAHAELDAVDQIMADPVEFKKVSAEPDFYTRYEALQKASEKAFAAWEKATVALEKCQKAYEAIAP
jgi:ATP-binding cassette subfamily F protein 3